MSECFYYLLSKIDYEEGLKLQRAAFQKVSSGDVGNILLLLEHNPVITLGRRGKKENLLVEESFLKEKGIGLYNVERGGDITYHGPGQVVGYPILNLNQNRDIHKLVRSVEDVLIKVIRLYGIDGKRIKGLTGVWVGNEKIAAIGMAVKKWISFHGFALNVSTNLDYFKYIRPCGIDDKGVTSIERILGKNSPSIEDVERDIIEQFGEVFGFAMKRGFEFIGKEL